MAYVELEINKEYIVDIPKCGNFPNGAESQVGIFLKCKNMVCFFNFQGTVQAVPRKFIKGMK